MLSDDGLKTANEWLRMIVEVGLFCRKGLSPEGEPCLQSAEDRSRNCVVTCKLVAASREVLPGRQDLLFELPDRQDRVNKKPGFWKSRASVAITLRQT